MLKRLPIDIIWLILMALTVGTALVAENTDPGLLVTLAVAATVAFKGTMIVDHFMELLNARRWLREAMRTYFFVIPLFIILVYLFPDKIIVITNLFVP